MLFLSFVIWQTQAFGTQLDHSVGSIAFFCPQFLRTQSIFLPVPPERQEQDKSVAAGSMAAMFQVESPPSGDPLNPFGRQLTQDELLKESLQKEQLLQEKIRLQHRSCQHSRSGQVGSSRGTFFMIGQDVSCFDFIVYFNPFHPDYKIFCSFIANFRLHFSIFKT